ncbi:MAG: di-trans,poly-cis-decaprenylcistransferase [Phycisphaerae bacterium]|jgi:undecaprenyl diphosphate synthase|nr:di-trans,poly-cis-decaprenylcistransferase [Phycisphaerae bacterium]
MAEQLPVHIAIIMDGNGRWAEGRGLPRSAGHEAGALSVKKVVERCGELGVQYLTLYSFSTENWGRPQEEIDALMGLLVQKLSTEVPELIEKGVSLRHLGRRDRFAPEVLQALDEAIKATASGTRLTLYLALDYSGRSELLQAIGRLVQDGVEATSENLEQRLFTRGVPDPDLLIRTAGEMRISNFLLWQIAYSEIYVSEQCWPDFDSESLDVAIAEYTNRERTFGKIK